MYCRKGEWSELNNILGLWVGRNRMSKRVLQNSFFFTKFFVFFSMCSSVRILILQYKLLDSTGRYGNGWIASFCTGKEEA